MPSLTLLARCPQAANDVHMLPLWLESKRVFLTESKLFRRLSTNNIVRLSVLIFKGYERKHLQLIAGGLAYYFVMSLFPALISVTAIAAYLPIKNGAQKATSFIAHVVPQQSLSLLKPIVNSITLHRRGLLWLGLLTTLWLASAGTKAMIGGLDLVYEVHQPRSLWVNKILAFVLTIIIGALLLLAVLLTLVGPVVERILVTAVPVQGLWISLWPYLQWLLAALFTLSAIELLYRLAPNVRASKHKTTPGAIVAATAWLILSWALSVFFHEFAGSKLDAMYGVLAAPIALLTWLKGGAMAILIGAQINVSLQSQRRNRTEPGVVEPKPNY